MLIKHGYVINHVIIDHVKHVEPELRHDQPLLTIANKDSPPFLISNII